MDFGTILSLISIGITIIGFVLKLAGGDSDNESSYDTGVDSPPVRSHLGTMMPSLEGTNIIDGNFLATDNYKGKYVLINIWSVWSTPHFKEFPALSRLYESVDKSKIEFLGIIGDSPQAKAKSIVENWGVNWAQMYMPNDSRLKTEYGDSPYPMFIFIDKNGIVVAENFSALEAEEMVKQIY